jgi:hypothetical protein
VIPPKKSARFVWRMEEVLDLYERPYDPLFPVVCFDERPCQLLAEVREPLPVGPGVPERRDHEYERRGTAHVSMAFEPLTGWRRVEVTERRRGREFAEAVGRLAEEVYPGAERIRLVSDNLSTRSAAAFYETFPPEQAWRPAERVEFVHTPVHGSWLNMVEIELSVLVRQCLKRRLPDVETLRREAEAWEEERNRAGASVRTGASRPPTLARSCASSTRLLSLDEGVVLPLITPTRYRSTVMGCVALTSQTGGGRKQAGLARQRELSLGSVVDTNRGGRGVPPIVRQLGCVLTIPAPAAGELARAVATTDGDFEGNLRWALAASRSVGIGVRSSFQAK